MRGDPRRPARAEPRQAWRKKRSRPCPRARTHGGRPSAPSAPPRAVPIGSRSRSAQRGRRPTSTHRALCERERLSRPLARRPSCIAKTASTCVARQRAHSRVRPRHFRRPTRTTYGLRTHEHVAAAASLPPAPAAPPPCRSRTPRSPGTALARAVGAHKWDLRGGRGDKNARGAASGNAGPFRVGRQPGGAAAGVEAGPAGRRRAPRAAALVSDGSSRG